MSAATHSEVAPENQHDGTVATDVDLKAGRRKVARTRGVFSGILLILLGAWAALAPFIGPYFDFGYNPRSGDAWHWTSGRGLYEVLPGGVTLLAGIVLLASASRVLTVLLAWLAALAGVWLVIAPTVATRLSVEIGTVPTGASADQKIALPLLYFFATGAAIAVIAGIAIGRLSVHSVRDVRAAERHAEAQAAAEAERQEAERVELERREQERLEHERLEHERREHERRDTDDQQVGHDADRRTAAMPVVDGQRDHDAQNAPTAAHPIVDDDRYAAPAATPYESAGRRDAAGSSSYSGHRSFAQPDAEPAQPASGAHAVDPETTPQAPSTTTATPASVPEDDRPHDPSAPPPPGGTEQYRYGTTENPAPPEERGR